jgi:hypothetical protein
VEWDREGAFKAYGEITFAANTGRLYKAWADGTRDLSWISSRQ